MPKLMQGHLAIFVTSSRPVVVQLDARQSACCKAKCIAFSSRFNHPKD
jgi:hypothetical protein